VWNNNFVTLTLGHKPWHHDNQNNEQLRYSTEALRVVALNVVALIT
jgi:hypothetical protein